MVTQQVYHLNTMELNSIRLVVFKLPADYISKTATPSCTTILCCVRFHWELLFTPVSPLTSQYKSLFWICLEWQWRHKLKVNSCIWFIINWLLKQISLSSIPWQINTKKHSKTQLCSILVRVSWEDWYNSNILLQTMKLQSVAS